MIKKILAIACFSLACLSTLIAQEKTYAITGMVKGIKKGWATLYYTDEAGVCQTDSAAIVNERFSFKGKAYSYPRFSYFGVGGTPINKAIFMDAGKINIAANKDSVDVVKVNGESATGAWIAFENSFAEVQEMVKAGRKKISDWTDEGKKSLTTEQDSLLAIENNKIAAKADVLVEQYIVKHKSSVISAFLIANFYSAPDKEATEARLYGMLEPSAQQSHYGQLVKKSVDGKARTSIGKPAPAFTQQDTTGKNVSLADLRGKYVLVDFWASWCGPCREENPNVVKAYNKFKDKNFTIISISLDNDKAKWEKAIQQDGLTWTHVSDLQGWKNEVAQAYDVHAVPTNFLLDPNGVIIAKNLRGEELEKILQQKLNMPVN